MSEPEEIVPGPLERAYRRALDNGAELDDADRQRRRAAVLAQVAALDVDQRRKRVSATAANRPSWLMLGGSALALALSAGLVWQLSANREAEPLAGASMDGVKVAASPTPPPPPPPSPMREAEGAAQAPIGPQPVPETAPPRSVARTDSSPAKAAKAQAAEVPAVLPAPRSPADITVAQAPAPAAAPMQDLAPPSAAPAAALRPLAEKRAQTMAPPTGAAALQAPPEPAWLVLIRNDDRAGLRAALDAGLDVDAVDAAGRTPLMHAAIQARPELIAELLARSASRTRTDRLGLTAAGYAARSPDSRVRAALSDQR